MVMIKRLYTKVDFINNCLYNGIVEKIVGKMHLVITMRLEVEVTLMVD